MLNNCTAVDAAVTFMSDDFTFSFYWFFKRDFCTKLPVKLGIAFEAEGLQV